MPDSLGISERGFSLVEVLTAVVIATVAVVGLAYTFSMGRAFINRFEIARAATAAAQGELEALAVASPTDAALSVGLHPSIPFTLGGETIGDEAWDVRMVSALGGAGTDLKQVTVMVSWVQGSLRDTVQLSRLFPPR